MRQPVHNSKKNKKPVSENTYPVPMLKYGKVQKLSNWFKDNWRTLAFITYFSICIFDFIIMPVIYQIFNSSIDPATLSLLVQHIKDPSVQLEFLRLYGTKMAWAPLTLAAGGTFHIAFGAILTAAGYTRGQEKIASIRQGAINPKPDNPDNN